MRGWRLSRSTAFRASAAGIDDRRLQVMAHSATQMATDYDVVFSCLPLLSIPVRISVRILQQARQRLLARNGTLVLFNTATCRKNCCPLFSLEAPAGGAQFPPALVYVCTPR